MRTPGPSVDGSGTVVDWNLRHLRGDGKLVHKLTSSSDAAGADLNLALEGRSCGTDTLGATGNGSSPGPADGTDDCLAVHPYRVLGASRPSRNHVFISPFPFTNTGPRSAKE